MNFPGLVGAIGRPFGSGLFSAFDDIRGDNPTPPETLLLAAENGDNLLTESALNYIANT